MKRIARLLLPTLALLAVYPFAQAGEASGTITHEAKSGPIRLDVKHAYLFSGPDMVSGNIIRQLVLSDVDLLPEIKDCQTLPCVAGSLNSGVTVEFDAGPRLGYWFVANNQRIQHSGVARHETADLTADTANRLTGAWKVAGGKGIGPSIDVKFDTTLTRAFKK